jgi:prephenate dehydrogenase
MSNQMKLGIIGLGKMGGNLALQAIEKNIEVTGKARKRKPELEKKRCQSGYRLQIFCFLSGTSQNHLLFFASWPDS